MWYYVPLSLVNNRKHTLSYTILDTCCRERYANGFETLPALPTPAKAQSNAGAGTPQGKHLVLGDSNIVSLFTPLMPRPSTRFNH